MCYLCMSSLTCVCVLTGGGRGNESSTSYTSGMRQRSRKINTLSASQHPSFHALCFFSVSHHHRCHSSCSTLSITHSLSFSLCCFFCLITLSSFISSLFSFVTSLSPPQSSRSLFPFLLLSHLCVTFVRCCSFFISPYFPSSPCTFIRVLLFPTCVICHPIRSTI